MRKQKSAAHQPLTPVQCSNNERKHVFPSCQGGSIQENGKNLKQLLWGYLHKQGYGKIILSALANLCKLVRPSRAQYRDMGLPMQNSSQNQGLTHEGLKPTYLLSLFLFHCQLSSIFIIFSVKLLLHTSQYTYILLYA